MAGKQYGIIAIMLILVIMAASAGSYLSARIALINATADACSAAAEAYGYPYGGGRGSLTDAQIAANEAFHNNDKLPDGFFISLSVSGEDVSHVLVCKGTAKVKIFPLVEVNIGITSVAGVR